MHGSLADSPEHQSAAFATAVQVPDSCSLFLSNIHSLCGACGLLNRLHRHGQGSQFGRVRQRNSPVSLLLGLRSITGKF